MVHSLNYINCPLFHKNIGHNFTMVCSNFLHTIFFILLISLPTSFCSPPITTTANHSTMSAAHTPSRRFSKIYAFGDSFTDTGNTHSSTGPSSFGHVSSPPYGTTFFHHPTNRYSDGRLVVDFLASALSLPYIPPYLNHASDFSHGVDFAVAGSTALDNEFFIKNNITIDITPQSLGTQLGWFRMFMKERGCRKRGSRECNDVMDDALFWIGEIGANDYAYSFGSSVPPKTIRDLAVRNMYSFLQELLDRGAKYIVVQGLPLIGCLPLTMFLAPPDDRDEIKCSAVANNYSYMQNTLVQAKLQELRMRYPKAVISYADYYNAHRTIMKNPAMYGFAEPFKTCCGSGGGPYNFDIFTTCGSPNVTQACPDPTKFVNWDGVHLTEATYKVVADMFFHHGYCRPPFDVLLNTKTHGN